METDDVLAMAAERALATGTRMVDPIYLEQAAAEAGIDHDRFFAAAAELKERQLIQLATAEPSQVVLLALTNAGLQQHLAATRPDFGAVERRLVQAATDAAGQGAVPLAAQLGEPPLLVECLLDAMVSERKLVYSKAPGHKFRIHRVL